MKAMRILVVSAMVTGFLLGACSSESGTTEGVGAAEDVGTAESALSCTGVFCPPRSHCEIGSNGFPTCVGDTPICGGTQCGPWSVCCNANCANPFCFSGSGACPPVPCQ